jgi:hypothetical protein
MVMKIFHLNFMPFNSLPFTGMTESAVEINLGAETMRCKPFLIAKDTVHK